MRALSTCIVVLGVLTAAAFPFACGSEPYIGGDCETTKDCLGGAQVAPGTLCVDDHCVCSEPGKVVCCAKGEEGPNCTLACRFCSDCAPGTSACGGAPGQPCERDVECAGPPDPRCGEGLCVEGRCTMVIRSGVLEANRRGDCKQHICTSEGVVTVRPLWDPYDDGNECTADLCDDIDRPRNPAYDGLTCSAPRGGEGRCYRGRCVECVEDRPSMADCPAGLTCHGVFCVPLHCVNMRFDPDLGETAQDCGGKCAPCRDGDPCKVGDDCPSGVCVTGRCKVATCNDGVKNGDETGVDCSGSCPHRCPDGSGCKTDEDCESGVCWAGKCQAPTCKDGVKNGDETGVDCGGTSCPTACFD